MTASRYLHFARNVSTTNYYISGLSQRAGHPLSTLHLLHGSLFDIKCTSFYCNYTEQNNFTDPIVPALTISTVVPQTAPSDTGPSIVGAKDSSHKAALHNAIPSAMSTLQISKELDISDDRVEIPELEPKDLPQCPRCKGGILRPGVVWFGEMLPTRTLKEIDDFIKDRHKIDLILVIGTSAQVHPAAGYVDKARAKGARVAVINMEKADTPGRMQKGDWFFEGDAGVIIPEILKSVIGDIK